MSGCWFYSVLHTVAATVTFQRLFWYVEVVLNVLSCPGAVPVLRTATVHGCVVGGANACPASKERNSHKWDTFDWGVSFAWELKTFPCPCHLKFLLLKISHYLFLYLCNAGGFNLKCLNSLYFKDTLTRTNINFLINCLLKVMMSWFGPLEAGM